MTAKRVISLALRLADKAIDVAAWLHHSIMLYLCLFWLLPLFALVLVSWLLWDLRPLLKGEGDTIFLYDLSGYPLWLGLGLYAEVATTPWARRLKHGMGRAPVQVGYVILALGGIFWLFGVI